MWTVAIEDVLHGPHCSLLRTLRMSPCPWQCLTRKCVILSVQFLSIHFPIWCESKLFFRWELSRFSSVNGAQQTFIRELILKKRTFSIRYESREARKNRQFIRDRWQMNRFAMEIIRITFRMDLLVTKAPNAVAHQLNATKFVEYSNMQMQKQGLAVELFLLMLNGRDLWVRCWDTFCSCTLVTDK